MTRHHKHQFYKFVAKVRKIDGEKRRVPADCYCGKKQPKVERQGEKPSFIIYDEIQQPSSGAQASGGN